MACLRRHRKAAFFLQPQLISFSLASDPGDWVVNRTELPGNVKWSVIGVWPIESARNKSQTQDQPTRGPCHPGI